MRAVCIIILLLCLSGLSIAQDMTFSRPENETRYQALLPQIRCMVCANQSVADSQSGFAQDMKIWVYDQIEAGRSDMEIRSELISRFGDTVLYSPRLKLSTYLLWGAPFLMVLMVLLIWYRGTRS